MSEMMALRAYDGIDGGRRILWYEFRSVIAKLMQEYNLEAVNHSFLPQRGQAILGDIIRPWPCGGIKGPHFHYGDKVYPVTTEIWNEFTHTVLDRCRASLDKAATVMEVAPLSVNTVAELGETATMFPPEGKELW